MKWQKIETAPKDGTQVLLCDSHGNVGCGYYAEDWAERREFVRKAKDGDVYRIVREDIGYWDSNLDYCPDFWMPLPDAPKGDLNG